MGGGYSTQQSSSQSAPQLTPQQLLSLYGQSLPSIANVGGSSISPINTSLATSAAQANPIYTGSGLEQLDQYGAGYTGSGANLSNLNDLLSSGILSQGGTALANSATPLINAANPAQGASENQATNLVNSINLNGLTGGEQEATERSLNQSLNGTGNLGLNNPTNTIANAMNFGQALQAKRAALGSALSSASGVAGTQDNIFSPVSTALQNPGSTNFGLSTFNPTQANSTLTSPLSFLSSIFGPIAGNASSQTSKSQGSGSSFNVSL